jgi:hypothetical protein
MQLSSDLARYFVWAGIVAIGSLMAVLDWRWIRWPLFAVFLVAGVGAGLIITKINAFSFGGGSYYMEGVIISAGAALALIGYAFAVVCQYARRRSRRHDRS